MQEYIQYLIPVFALAALAAGWMGVQLLAKKLKTKNHIDGGGCCGACNGKTCEK
ncbi:MAG: hypothetical protein IAE67_04845 [Candidatus Competibacteraceae bacterium]|nr:hypothetical protein [Candidatus Competibacteraceae bacterium]